MKVEQLLTEHLHSMGLNQLPDSAFNVLLQQLDCATKKAKKRHEERIARARAVADKAYTTFAAKAVSRISPAKVKRAFAAAIDSHGNKEGVA